MKKMAALMLMLAAGTVNAAEKDIVATAVEAKDFPTLVTLVKEAGLVETLQGKGPFTVFAPTEEAFKKIPKDKLEALLKDKEALKKVLLAHVVAGNVMAADVVKLDGKDAKTVGGASFKISAGKTVKIGEATVVKTDIKCSNGVIHVIDTVLIP
jgi:uncharacterized surface protein with fasciclin (FAS1) repeats